MNICFILLDLVIISKIFSSTNGVFFYSIEIVIWLSSLMKNYFLVVLILFLCIFFFSDVYQLIMNVKRRIGEFDDCVNWCNSDGIFIKFSKQEKQYCEQKCLRYIIEPPLRAFECRIRCQVTEGSECRNEYCSLWNHMTELSVTDGIKERFYSAIARKWLT